jgi:hypothetical protein
MNKYLSFLIGITTLSASAQLMAETQENNYAQEIEALKQQVEALASVIEEGGAASASKTTIGGYGEHHLNALSGDGSYSDKDQVDAHRYVLFVNHEYSDDLKFFSELELEHSLAGDGKPGEVELEQAFIEKTMNNGDHLSMGLFLVPVGFLNETHEPDTFYGVERNNVEKNIIPTTWWETGVMYSGGGETVSYDLALHSGMDAVDFGDHDGDEATADVPVFSKIRSGRQKSAEADGKNKAFTARVSASPGAGLELGLTVQHQEDISGNDDIEIDANLVAINAAWQKGAVSLRTLYAMWDINDDVEDLAGGTGASEAEGFYAEAAYKLKNNLGVFTRYSEWDNKAADSVESGFDQFDVGVNYWLHERVVMKADYQQQTKKSDDSELNGVNLGLGWSF